MESRYTMRKAQRINKLINKNISKSFEGIGANKVKKRKVSWKNGVFPLRRWAEAWGWLSWPFIAALLQINSFFQQSSQMDSAKSKQNWATCFILIFLLSREQFSFTSHTANYSSWKIVCVIQIGEIHVSCVNSWRKKLQHWDTQECDWGAVHVLMC